MNQPNRFAQRWRRPAVWFGSTVALALLLSLGVISISFAVHDLGLFELDGNVADNAAPGDDWANIVAHTDHAKKSVIVFDDGADGIDDLAEINFLGGGSKDDLDLPNWHWDTSPVPDKDDIMTAGAALYTSGADTVIYFFLDRFSSGTGDADVGFWFFEGKHNLVPSVGDPTKGTFSGVHSVGDILILSEFTIGGGVSTVKVFEWVGDKNGSETSLIQPPAGAGDGPLQLRFVGADCRNPDGTPRPGGDIACATVNKPSDGVIVPPWNYTDKQGTNDYGPAAFYEGGVNATRLNLDIGCGGTFLANTRASQSTDARLHDFAIGDFDLCHIAVDKTGDTLSKVGDAVNYTITITNDGAITLYKDDISDTLFGDLVVNGLNQANPNAWTTFNFATATPCGANLAAGASCTIRVTRIVQAGDADPLPNTVTIHYNNKLDFTGTDTTASDGHSVNLFQPSVVIDKTGDTLSKVGDAVNYTITVTNTSSSDSPKLSCVISDALLGLNKNVSLAPGDTNLTSASRTVQAGDPDPLLNTARIFCTVDGFGNELRASHSHSVNLFQPSIAITKTGDTLSKVGDDVRYTIEVCNTSSADSPDLIKDSVSDSLIGGVNAAFGASLSPGICESHNFTRTVQAGDLDPVVNTATAHYHPAGFPNDITASDSHSVNLFQPSLTITKTGDTLSKVGDLVTYTIKVCNTSSADSPNLVKDSVTDSLIPAVNAAFAASLSPGACESHDFGRTVVAADPDPLVNIATAHYHPAGFPNDISGSARHSVNLFQPSIAVSKQADTPISKAGDTVNYTINITNTGTSDSPNLIKDSILDSLLTLSVPAACDNLAPGASCTITAARTVLADDPDPLVNIVTVHFHPLGFPNDITATASASVDLVHPRLAVAKNCAPTIARVGDTINYSCTISNTGDVTLDRVSIMDSLKGDLTNPANFTSSSCGASLAAGASCTIAYTFTAPAGTSSLVNTVTAVYQVHGLPNRLTASASCTVTIPSEGCTPGYWKTHPERWDQPTDPFAAAAGFTTGTSFNAFFNLTPAQSGFADSLTMLDAISLGGGDGAKLARHGISALLNLGAGLNYALPPGINNATDLYNAIRNAYLTNTFEPLASQLAAANELNCPF